MFTIYRVGLMNRARLREYDLTEAVTEAMNGECNRDGALERLGEQLDNHARFVGELVEILAKRKLIDADELGKLLGYQFSVEPAKPADPE